MTRPDLDALEKLADEATPGPWIIRTLENFGWNVVHYRNRDGFNIERVSKCAHEENAAFIAAANPAAIKALIAELKEGRRLMEPFASAAEKLDGLWDENDWRWNESVRSNVTVRDIRSVSAFLARNGKGEG